MGRESLCIYQRRSAAVKQYGPRPLVPSDARTMCVMQPYERPLAVHATIGQTSVSGRLEVGFTGCILPYP